MLELKNITKDYSVGDLPVHALKGISLAFRAHEFVSILGPSGCGKTTLLNIIGGLDQYTDGNLIISGRSTKEYRDRDWDSYRNHRIGFVFQSYNLIPHQSVLQNVELALTLSGVSKAERRKRAAEVLAKVGLSDQLHKKPTQMSGGQMQRVAIARALINNPDILLADEPTGALDTETSVAVMELLKEISKDKLVIMVTHNPELADRYSSRIIRLLDGVITSDSDAYSPTDEETVPNETDPAGKSQAEEAAMPPEQTDIAPMTSGKTSMSPGKTSMSPGKTEKASQKTSMSPGKTEKASQKTSMSSGKTSMSFLTALSLSLNNLMTKKTRTFLTAFAGSIGIIGIALILSLSNGVNEYINRVQEETLSTYPLTIQKATTDVSSLMATFMGVKGDSEDEHDMDQIYSSDVMGEILGTMMSEVKVNDLAAFKEYLDNSQAIQENVTDIKYSYDINLNIFKSDTTNGVVQVNPSTMLTKMWGAMGMTDSTISEMSTLASMNGSSAGMNVWTELIGNNTLLASQYDMVKGHWPEDYNEVVLIVDEHNEISDFCLYSLGIKDQNQVEELFKQMMSGNPVKSEQTAYSYDELLNLTFSLVLPSDYYTYNASKEIWENRSNDAAYMQLLLSDPSRVTPIKVVGIIRPNENAVATSANGAIGYTHALTEYVIQNTQNSEILKQQLADPKTDVFTGLPFEGSKEAITADLVREQLMQLPDEQKKMFAAMMQAQGFSKDVAFEDIINSLSDEQLMQMFGNYAKQDETENTYEKNLYLLGYAVLEQPSMISIFPKDFESKDRIVSLIDEYNASHAEEQQIEYTDFIAILMSSISTIINAITYILIAFVAISLVVSSIMIGIITYISVLERTKEIGILRAIGASKKDISRVFNAETLIVGFTAGAIGILVTALLCIPINLIIRALVNISGIASLPYLGAIILILISMFLTLIAGLIPSRIAAKKDPVTALRSE